MKNKNEFTLSEFFSQLFAGQRKTAFTLAEVFSRLFAGQCKIAFTLAEVFSRLFAGQCKIAFTLAEVLITLGIIGVVAAMTMPTLLNRMQNKELQTQFKKTYTELNQIAQMFYLDYGISIPEYLDSKGKPFVQDFIDNIFIKYLKGNRKVSHWDYDVQDENGTSVTTMPYKLYAMSGTSVVGSICDYAGMYSAVNGVGYFFNDPPSDYTALDPDSSSVGMNGPVVCVDINGKKKPNRYGMDFFLFVFTRDGFVIPMGQEHKDNTTSTRGAYNFFVSGPEYCKADTNQGHQYACAHYALMDKHPSKDGLNYWQDFLGGK